MNNDISQAFSKILEEKEQQKLDKIQEGIEDLKETFGYLLGKDAKDEQDKNVESFVPKQDNDASVNIATGSSYGTFVDLDGHAKNEGQLITKYRQMSHFQECDMAISDICNESIITDDNEYPVKMMLDKVELPENIKNKINDQFEYILELLDFKSDGYDIFKRWYIDGRIFYHMAIDVKNPKKGILELRYIDPRRLKKVKLDKKQRSETGVVTYKTAKEFYIYFPKIDKRNPNNNDNRGIKITADSIASSHSGILNENNSLIYSHLHKAIKPLNNLRMLEDAIVIYRLARAPERRIFYIDVGNLPKAKAEQHLHDMMTKHKNKLVYDATTGSVRDDRKFMTMLEDFWLPRRGDGKSTEITTLEGGQSLGELADIEYFQRKLYKSLNVPITRLEAEGSFNLGRSSEITRDEVKFSKFIARLRTRFCILFENILEIQLSLLGIMSREDWKKIKSDIFFEFIEDNHYSELKDTEIWRERLSLLAEVDQFKDVYFSEEWVMTNILRFSEEEIKEMKKQQEKEAKERAEREEEMGPPPEEEQPGGAPDEEQEPAPGPVTINVHHPNHKANAAKKGPNEELEVSLLSDEDSELIETYTKVLDKVLENV